MKKIIWMLSLALFSQVFLQAVTNKVLDKKEFVSKIEIAWLKYKLSKPFYFKDSQGNILAVLSLAKLKKLSPVLYTKASGPWPNSNEFILDKYITEDAVPYMSDYINSYGSDNISNIEKLIKSPYIWDVLEFVSIWQINDLKNIILQNIASLASKYNLYTELDCENLEQLIDRLSLDSDTARKALEVNIKYFLEILKSSVKEVITHDSGAYYDITFSNNNKYLAFCLNNGKVKLYDLENKHLIEDSVITHDVFIRKIVFSNDNKYLASLSNYGQVKLYDLENKQLIEDLVITHNCIDDIVFSNDGKYLALCLKNGQVKLYDLENKHLIEDLVITNDNSSNIKIIFSNDNKYMALCSDNRVELYDLKNKQLIEDLVTHNDCIDDIVFSNDSKYLVLCGNGIDLYDLENKLWIEESLFIDHYSTIYHIVFSNDNKYLALWSEDNTIELIDLENKQLIKDIFITSGDYVFCGRGSLTDAIKKILFSNDSKYLALCSYNGEVRLYDLENKQLIEDLVKNTTIIHDKVNDMAFSNNGIYLALCSKHGKVKLYDLENKKLIDSIITHSDEVNNIAFSNNNKYLASCSRDGAVNLAGDTSHMSNKEIFNIVEKIEKL